MRIPRDMQWSRSIMDAHAAGAMLEDLVLSSFQLGYCYHLQD